MEEMNNRKGFIFDEYDEALNKALFEVPYNSCAQIVEYFANEKVGYNKGASCAWQTFFVADEVRKLGVRNKPKYLRDGRHVAAVYFNERDVIVLDPYLLHTQAIRFSAPLDSTDHIVTASVDAYPVRVAINGEVKWSRLKGTLNMQKKEIRLDYIRFSPSKNHNYIYRSFTLAFETAMEKVPSPPEEVRNKLLHSEQNNLSVRAVCSDSKELTEIILPLKMVAEGKRPCREWCFIKSNLGEVIKYKDSEFDPHLGVIAKAIDSEPSDVLDYLVSTAFLYHSVMPVGQVLSAYSMEND
ncbi:hypothetical protein [Marinobacter sp. LN3S78]|uniref:hypothetical protein n=1 Tax=Marinobacter sp. LN3S78 TaxID=3382300 RepID=UPI00387AB9C2